MIKKPPRRRVPVVQSYCADALAVSRRMASTSVFKDDVGNPSRKCSQDHSQPRFEHRKTHAHTHTYLKTLQQTKTAYPRPYQHHKMAQRFPSVALIGVRTYPTLIPSHALTNNHRHPATS